MHKSLLILLFNPILCFSQQKKTDSAYINEIVRAIDNIGKVNSKSFTKDKIVGKKKFIENWQHFDNHNLSRIVIDYTIDSTAYSEKYYFKDGSLIYAYESIILFYPDLGIDQGTMWAGDFYFSKGKLIDHVTLGHGKSEKDDWDPEKEILQRLKKRKMELQLLK